MARIGALAALALLHVLPGISGVWLNLTQSARRVWRAAAPLASQTPHAQTGRQASHVWENEQAARLDNRTAQKSGAQAGRQGKPAARASVA
jgi:hypothetical protein